MTIKAAHVNVTVYAGARFWLRNCGKLDFIATRLRGSKTKDKREREIWIEKLKQSNPVKVLEL